MNISVDNVSFLVSNPSDGDCGFGKVVRVKSLWSDANIFGFGTDELLMFLDFGSIRILETVSNSL